MTSYYFSPDRLPDYKRQLLRQYSFTILPLPAFAFIYGYCTRQYSFGFSLLVTLGGLAALTIGYLITSSQRSKAMLGYSISIDSEKITRRLPNTMPLAIRFSDINRVVANEEGLILKNNRAGQSLIISPYVTDYDQLASELQAAIPNFHISAPTLAEKAMRFRSFIIGGLFLLPYLLIKLTH